MSREAPGPLEIGNLKLDGYPRNFAKKGMFRLARRAASDQLPGALEVLDDKYVTDELRGKLDGEYFELHNTLAWLVRAAAAVDGWKQMSVRELLAVREASVLSELCRDMHKLTAKAPPGELTQAMVGRLAPAIYRFLVMSKGLDR